MTVRGTRVHRGTYLDSLLLMATTVTMDQRPGVSWAGAVMAGPRGLEELAAAGFAGDELAGLDANDLVLAVAADDEETVQAALDAGRDAAFSERDTEGPRETEGPPADLAEAVRRHPESTVAVVSVPGEYAALEAHHALTEGLHVLLFSDNVSVDEEVELKDRAVRLGRLVMGPGAGTAVLAGTGLGFANVLRADGQGRTGEQVRGVGVVAAAGTGAQEVSTLLDRWGVPVTQVIGVGGRDLTAAVGGRMARAAVRTLDADPSTGVILLVSKPPAADVAAAVLGECRTTGAVAVFLGLDELAPPPGVQLVSTLEAGARAAATLAGGRPPTPGARLSARVAEAAGALGPERRTVRGLFSGGTLCYEAQYLLESALGPVWSNEPLRPAHKLPAPAGASVLLDLGAEEYTLGRPHPMIDPAIRLEHLEKVGTEPEVAVVLLDVVLGYGSAEDPAGRLAPVCAQLMADGGPRVVAYVLGTDGDPQDLAGQRTRLEEAGCIVADTNARAAYAAAAIALRRPELVEEGL